MTEHREAEVTVIIDRIIKITENNITMQEKNLDAQHKLESRLEGLERDHNDFKEDLKAILVNSFEIINKMKMASNEKIISLVEDLVLKLNELENVKNKVDQLCIQKELLDQDKITIKQLADNTAEVATSHKWIKAALGLIALLVLAFQIIFSIYKVNQNEELSKFLKQQRSKTSTNK